LIAVVSHLVLAFSQNIVEKTDSVKNIENVDLELVSISSIGKKFKHGNGLKLFLRKGVLHLASSVKVLTIALNQSRHAVRYGAAAASLNLVDIASLHLQPL
jgi:hypothetical protein